MTTEKFENLLYEVERGRARVNGPEVRDERGFLIDD